MRFTLISTIVATVGLGMAQLSGKVGPSTSREDKAAKKLCNILDHGGVASETTDNSMAITKAWESCKEGGQILIPEGKFGLGKWIELSGGKGLSLNLEGIIIRSGNGTAGESMITVQKTEDFEFYSASSKGAIQGYGFEFHERNSSGPGMLSLSEVTSFSIHDLALVDSPSSHLSVDRSANGEIFNLVVHGGDRAGLNGVDVSSTNIWVHDLEVSNGDDCVAVKSPASNVLIESIFCNLSGGCAVGPSGENTNITEIIYRNIYSQRCKHMLSIKSNGGSGFFNNAIFTNFTGHTNDDAINLDSKWQSQEPAPGEGVEYDYLDFTNWAGTCKNNKVPLIHLQCSPDILCGSLNVDSVNVWTEAGDSVSYVCENAYGMGACMNPFAGNGRYTSTTSVTSMAPTSYAITTMPAEITQGLGVTTSIDIPPVPTTYFPGLKPASTLLGKV